MDSSEIESRIWLTPGLTAIFAAPYAAAVPGRRGKNTLGVTVVDVDRRHRFRPVEVKRRRPRVSSISRLADHREVLERFARVPGVQDPVVARIDNQRICVVDLARAEKTPIPIAAPSAALTSEEAESVVEHVDRIRRSSLSERIDRSEVERARLSGMDHHIPRVSEVDAAMNKRNIGNEPDHAFVVRVGHNLVPPRVFNAVERSRPCLAVVVGAIDPLPLKRRDVHRRGTERVRLDEVGADRRDTVVTPYPCGPGVLAVGDASRP